MNIRCESSDWYVNVLTFVSLISGSLRQSLRDNRGQNRSQLSSPIGDSATSPSVDSCTRGQWKMVRGERRVDGVQWTGDSGHWAQEDSVQWIDPIAISRMRRTNTHMARWQSLRSLQSICSAHFGVTSRSWCTASGVGDSD